MMPACLETLTVVSTLCKTGEEPDDRILFYHPASKRWIIAKRDYESEETFESGGGF